VALDALGLAEGHPAWSIVVDDIRSAAAALHAAGVAHGAITGSTIWIDTRGQAWLLGTGLGAGSVETDTTQIRGLTGPTTPELSSVLVRDPAVRDALVQRVGILLSAVETIDEPDDITHSRSGFELQPFDEVAADLGPDRGVGLFDDLRGETSWAEHTEPAEPTGPITDAARAVHRQLDVLVRLADAPPPDLSADAIARIPDDAGPLFRRALSLAQPAALLLPEVAHPPPLPGRPALGVLEEVTAALAPPAGFAAAGETTLPRTRPGIQASPLEVRRSETAPDSVPLARARVVLAVGIALVLLGALLIGAGVLSQAGD
jgi:hypothetical protein